MILHNTDGAVFQNNEINQRIQQKSQVLLGFLNYQRLKLIIINTFQCHIAPTIFSYLIGLSGLKPEAGKKVISPNKSCLLTS